MPSVVHALSRGNMATAVQAPAAGPTAVTPNHPPSPSILKFSQAQLQGSHPLCRLSSLLTFSSSKSSLSLLPSIPPCNRNLPGLLDHEHHSQWAAHVCLSLLSSFWGQGKLSCKEFHATVVPLLSEQLSCALSCVKPQDSLCPVSWRLNTFFLQKRVFSPFFLFLPSRKKKKPTKQQNKVSLLKLNHNSAFSVVFQVGDNSWSYSHPVALLRY